jgi:hypothetical protein
METGKSAAGRSSLARTVKPFQTVPEDQSANSRWKPASSIHLAFEQLKQTPGVSLSIVLAGNVGYHPLAKMETQLALKHQTPQHTLQRVRIAHWHEHARLTLTDNLGNGGELRSNNGHTGGARLGKHHG